MADTRTVETTKDFGKEPEASVERWLSEIEAYDKHTERWKKRCDKIVQRYRAEQETQDSDNYKREFNILWSNVQTLGPALFARTPVPDVSRRYKDRDPIGRAASTILERCLSYTVDTYDFGHVVKSARDDYLLTARGQTWVRYVPHFGEETQEPLQNEPAEDMAEDTAGEEPEPYRPVLYEEVLCDHISWDSFGHTLAPTWAKVTAVWKKELLTREQLNERFGEEIGGEVRLTKKSNDTISDDVATKFGDVFKRAEVYEIWDKTSRKAIWISPGYKTGPLDMKDDPLRLNGFFPCPRPIFGTTTTNSLIPVPDYVEYQSQALELDTLTQRIHLLLKALRVAGAYDSAFPALQNILEGEDNKLVPVDNWGMFAEKGAIPGAISFIPIKEIADVLLILSNSRNQIKQDLYEISGISDIVRGQVDPREKLGQSQLKGQFATLRLQDRQTEMNRFVRDNIRIKGEIIAEHFDPETMLQMSGWLETVEAKMLDKANADAIAKVEQMQQQMLQAQQAGQPIQPAQIPSIPPTAREVFDQAVELLKQDRLRTFRVDIETDSTTFEDQQAEKQSRTELLTAAGGFIQQAVAATETKPELTPLLGELLLFGLRGFKVGREMESAFEEALEDMKAAPARPQEGDPAVAAQAQADQAKTALEGQKLQLTSQKDQATLALEQQKFMHTSKLEEMRFQAEEAARQRDHQIKMTELDIRRMEAASKLTEAETRQGIEAQRLQLEGDKNVIEREKIQDSQVARHEQRQFDFTMREGDKEHEGEIRRLDGKVTPQVEEDVSATAQALAKVGDALVAFADRQDETIGQLMKAMTATKRLSKDAKGNKIVEVVT